MENYPRQTVEVTPAAKAAIESMVAWTSLNNKVIVERVLVWIGKQPQEVQAAILLSVPESLRSEFARMLLEKMAEVARSSHPKIAAKLHDEPGIIFADEPKNQGKNTEPEPDAPGRGPKGRRPPRSP